MAPLGSRLLTGDEIHVADQVVLGPFAGQGVERGGRHDHEVCGGRGRGEAFAYAEERRHVVHHVRDPLVDLVGPDQRCVELRIGVQGCVLAKARAAQRKA